MLDKFYKSFCSLRVLLLGICSTIIMQIFIFSEVNPHQTDMRSTNKVRFLNQSNQTGHIYDSIATARIPSPNTTSQTSQSETYSSMIFESVLKNNTIRAPNHEHAKPVHNREISQMTVEIEEQHLKEKAKVKNQKGKVTLLNVESKPDTLFDSTEDELIVNHVKGVGTRKWFLLVESINNHRKTTMKLPAVRTAEVRIRWESVLLAKHPELGPPPAYSVQQWGWGKPDELLTVDDDLVITGNNKPIPASKKLAGQYYPRNVRVLKNHSKRDFVNHTVNGDGDRVVFFLHVHKSGGSEVCFLSKLHNWTDGSLPNCNVPGFGPLNSGRGWFGDANRDDMTGDRLFERVKENGWKLFMSEITLIHHINTAKFLYAIQIRHPMKRIISHMRFEQQSEETAMSYIVNGTAFTPQSKNLGSGVTRGTAPYDNTLIRMLGGPSVFTKDPCTINETDYNDAVHKLSHFEIIIILERYEQDASIQFPRFLGWSTWYSRAGKFGFAGKVNLSPSGEALLKRLNRWDLGLYDVALVLATSLNSVAKSLSPPQKKLYKPDDFLIPPS